MANVLLVDDDPVVTGLVAKLLSARGHAVERISSGTRAIEVLRHTDIDLVITDFMMPGFDGRQLCEWIRGESRTRSVPIILITGRPDCDGAAWVTALGVEVMEKPIDGRALIDRVASLTTTAPLPAPSTAS